MAKSFDAIVIGSGPGGCVMARRLSDDGRQVLLLEAGPGLPLPEAVRGLDTIAANQERSRQWPDLQLRQGTGRGLGAVESRYLQGRGLGGSSVINSMLLSPGDSADYRRWEDGAGCRGWGPDAMAPWLAKAAACFPVESADPGPITSAFALAASTFGHQEGGSSLDADSAGFVTAALASQAGRRWSAIDAYLAGATESLTVATDCFVERLILEADAVVGVELASGVRHDAPLVILCAGALQTPALLSRSNLAGPSGGFGLKDHPSFVFTLRLRPGAGDTGVGDVEPTAQPRAISRLLRWSSLDADGADLQAFVLDDISAGGGQPGGQDLAVVAVALMDVRSNGSVYDDGSGLRFDTGALSDPDDRDRFRQGVRHIGALLASEPMIEVVEEVFIDENGTSAAGLPAIDDDELDRWLLAHPGPYAHVAASCPMGSADEQSTTVSCEPGTSGQLIGYEGIVLADSSVFPDLVSGGLQLPVAAVAERIAADVIGG